MYRVLAGRRARSLVAAIAELDASDAAARIAGIAVGDPSEDVRSAAASSLAQIGGPDAEQGLEALSRCAALCGARRQV